MQTEDIALVREYATTGSEAAFTELVKRHVDMVCSAALRRVGDAHLAALWDASGTIWTQPLQGS
jgi:hypothetical protein